MRRHKAGECVAHDVQTSRERGQPQQPRHTVLGHSIGFVYLGLNAIWFTLTHLPSSQLGIIFDDLVIIHFQFKISLVWSSK